MDRPRVLIVVTMDTKGEEALFMEARLKESGVDTLIMDPGIRGQGHRAASISRWEVARAGGSNLEQVQSLTHEGQALGIMTAGAEVLARQQFDRGLIQGVIGLGGSMGTTLGSAVMRALPLGFPKIMISTMASRDTRPFVGATDIIMLHSVSDLAGLNRITRKILANGAWAMAGLVKGQASARKENIGPLPTLLAISTLGTTEACARNVRQLLSEREIEIVTFHTVGAGGQALDELAASGEATAVLDLSLHELTDHRFGGDYDAGPLRGSVAGRRGLPLILVPGNMDFLVAGPLELARRRFPNRPYHVHNAAITCFRTTPSEMAELGRVLAELANEAQGPIAVVIPLGGLSAFDHPRGPMPDQAGIQLLADAVKTRLEDRIPLTLSPHHINDAEFALTLVETMGASWGWK